jgi:hypothetical protein
MLGNYRHLRCEGWTYPSTESGRRACRSSGREAGASAPPLHPCQALPRRLKKSLNCCSLELLRRSIKGGSPEPVPTLSATRRRDRRRSFGRIMNATTAEKSAKKITTKTVSTRVPSGRFHLLTCFESRDFTDAQLAHVAERHRLDLVADAACHRERLARETGRYPASIRRGPDPFGPRSRQRSGPHYRVLMCQHIRRPLVSEKAPANLEVERNQVPER